MPITDESRNHLLVFVAHVSMLQNAVHRNATTEQIHARLSQIDSDAGALADALAKDDPGLADAVRQAWQDPARVPSRSTAGAQRG